jgi:hypothetical protein
LAGRDQEDSPAQSIKAEHGSTQACHPQLAGSINKKITVQATLDIKQQDPIQKLTKAKRAQGMIQV